MPSRVELSVAALLCLALSCETGIGTSGVPSIETRIVGAGDFSQAADTALTYEYRFSAVNPDSLLIALWKARIPVVQAWLPLDNRCMDPRGPRFTVELAREDPRMAEFQFMKGTGRLACATMLKRFTFRER